MGTLQKEENLYIQRNLDALNELILERKRLLEESVRQKIQQCEFAAEDLNNTKLELDDMKNLNSRLVDKNEYATMILRSQNPTLLGKLAEDPKEKEKEKKKSGGF